LNKIANNCSKQQLAEVSKLRTDANTTAEKNKQQLAEVNNSFQK
jgi:hypothetical protein